MNRQSDSQATVAIVLCTYNGEKHLEEQLASYTTQTWPIAVRVFDDASSDNTLQIIKSFQNKLDIQLSVNPENLGYVGNFEHGIRAVLEEGFDYVALSDQDDIWHAEKIEKCMRAINQTENKADTSKGILVHSDLKMIDANKVCVHQSFLKYRQYELNAERDLAKILGQNGVMGNTILMNKSLASMALPFPESLHVHDYWLAVLAELHGQRVFIDEALLEYRLHENNASNSIVSTKFGTAKLLNNKSFSGLLKRDFRLPFKEDERLNVIDTLLAESSRFAKLSEKQKDTLTVFRKYLIFTESRIVILRSMLKAGFFRKGLRHRLRLTVSTLLTRRY